VAVGCIPTPELSGKGTWLRGGPLVELVVDVALVPFMLEQADNDTRAAAARHPKMSVFISKFLPYCFFTIQRYVIGW
jgi:hypothetical protein